MSSQVMTVGSKTPHTWAYKSSGYKCATTRVHVDQAGTTEIAKSHYFEPSVVVPSPTTDDWIRNTGEKCPVDKIAGQIEPFGNCS